MTCVDFEYTPLIDKASLNCSLIVGGAFPIKNHMIRVLIFNILKISNKSTFSLLL